MKIFNLVAGIAIGASASCWALTLHQGFIPVLVLAGVAVVVVNLLHEHAH